MTSRAGASLLELERDRLQGALSHLDRSVTELKAAIAETGPDLEFKQAINENVVLIAKYRARIAALEDEIKRSKGAKGDISLSQLATVPVEDNDMQEQQQQQHRDVAPPAQQPQQQHERVQQQQHTEAANGSTAMDVDASHSEGHLAAAVAGHGGSTQQTGIWL